MRMEVDETHRKRRPSAPDTAGMLGAGGMFIELAAKRSTEKPAARRDVSMFTKLSYLARKALSKRSKTPYVVILLRVTSDMRRCVERLNRNPIRFLVKQFSQRVLFIQSHLPSAWQMVGWERRHSSLGITDQTKGWRTA